MDDGLSDTACRQLIDRASRVVRDASGVLARGDVTYHRRLPPATHPWVRYVTRQQRRRAVYRGARAARAASSFAVMPVEQKLMVLAASNGATTNRYRRALELRPAQPGAAEASPPREEDGQGGTSDQPLEAAGDDHARPVVPRATRRRLMYNLTVPKILPTPRLRAQLVRHAVDHPSRPSHAMLSLAPCGSVRVWQYVVDSATAGVRYYKDAEGTRKRLAAPYLRNKLRNSQGGGSQCAKSAVSDAVDVVDAVDAITAAGAMSEEDKVALFQKTRTTHLEFDDGTGRVVVVAIEFDAAHSVQQAISKDGVAVPQQSLAGLIAETTLAADGGPVMRCSMTLFAMCLSTSVLRTAKSSTGRTGLLPLLLMLSGEQAIHSALSDRLWRGVDALLERPYVIRLVPGGDTGIRWATLRLPRLVRLCGDFAMQSHYLSISGGIHRCPGQWPCLPYRYMSLAALLLAPAEKRTPHTLSMLWEMAAWVLGRWCALRDGRWTTSEGQLTAKCRCGAAVVAVSMPVGGALWCNSSTCQRSFGTPLQTIAYTPLSASFKVIR